ncbi:peptidase A24A prepilin type IV [Nitratireductor aquibiodomus RA22]|uniref:Peptidase A24A prepilin type IV n=1 Tax=Nitratireductor aquibiodomus RA22 TaxID=1189611 RepID=I5BQ13_9HYPH|nr:prepilin peptidase [Nitratireductor aquibiodomus]EIM71665.1 peptidase A24A prepilin type IV [Nitratireductor aquibiodomus RA22]
MLEAVIFVIFPFCMVFAAVSDILSMTIANRVSLILIVAFVILAPFTGMEWPQIGVHLAVGALVLMVTFALFAIGGMGGGDAKLLAATAIWLGPSVLLVQYLVLASIFGGILTIALVFFRNSPFALFAGGNAFLQHLANEKAGIPYGIALGVAGLVTYPETPIMLWAFARLAGV